MKNRTYLSLGSTLGVLLGCAACGAPPSEGVDARGAPIRLTPFLHPLSRPDLSKIVPWRAVNLVGPTHRAWEEYDYRPRAQGGHREDIDARLERLRALGTRQVIIQSTYAWSIEREPYPGTTIRSTVAYRAGYEASRPETWRGVPRTRRGDMGLVAFFPPAHWDRPTPLPTPLAINRRAEAVLGEMLDAVRRKGMVPVLKLQVQLGFLDDAVEASPDALFADPSRNFQKFFEEYTDYVVAMTRVAARHGAALVILGSERPYIAGAGQSTFADGSRMSQRRAMIGQRWREMINAARHTAVEEDRADLAFTYTELGPFWEPRETTEAPAPSFSLVPFWDALDAVGVDLFLPGRSSDGNGGYDREPRDAQAMLRYGETHDFSTDLVPNVQDLRDHFAGQRNYNLDRKPVLIVADGCSATPAGAVNPAMPPELLLGSPPDHAEQRNLYEAHVRLAARYGDGWLGGIGFWHTSPTGRWGGAYEQGRSERYLDPAAYFEFLDTPAEETVRAYFQGLPERSGPRPPELLPNGGFERGAAPWTLGTWSGAARTAIAAGARNGRRALAITNPEAGSMGAASHQGLPVVGGARYRASAYVRLSGGGGGRAQLLLDWYGADWSHLGTDASTGLRGAYRGWVQDVLEVQAPAGAAHVQLHLASYALGTAHFDDVSLRRND